jgi:hypothetical protein
MRVSLLSSWDDTPHTTDSLQGPLLPHSPLYVTTHCGGTPYTPIDSERCTCIAQRAAVHTGPDPPTNCGACTAAALAHAHTVQRC